MKHIEQLLRRTIGLEAASIGSGLIERAVRLRMKSHGLKKVEDYGRLLESSPAERDELAESVIVTETWFFRDYESFAALVRLILEQWLPQHPTGPLRLLSFPCSSGEEPYSLAMALLNGGFCAQRLEIDAVDISARSLARAQLGLYGRNSFRGKDLLFRDRYFQSTSDGFILDERVGSCVRFHQANLLSDDFLRDKGGYDVIFCRNLLIYFDRQTQALAVEKMGRLLAPEGLLFVGPAEQPLAFAHGFVSANLPMAFACRKAGPASTRVDRRPGFAPPPTAELARGADSSELWRLAPQKAKLAAEPLGLRPANLEDARRLADAGRLKEAADLCQVHLRESGVSAQAYYMLGLVRDAGGDASAVECYRKALYLEPNHYETLLQMSLLAQKNGDLRRAQVFRERAQRIQNAS